MEEKEPGSDKEIILEQWKTCVEMADSVSNRRNVMNGLFITVNLGLITALTILLDLRSHYIAAAGILFCIIWFFLIRSYRSINQAKFDVINEIEKQLPVQAFNEEWKILKKKPRLNRFEHTVLEMAIPIAFIVIYIGLVLIECYV